MTNKEAIVKTKEKPILIKELINKIESSSNFVKELESKEKKRFQSIVGGLQSDTNNELTDTEYESIAKLIYFCDEFERHFKAQGIENADTDLLEIYRKMKTQITLFLKDYREGKKTTPASIKVIQNYLIKVSKSFDDIDELKLIKVDDAEIIDVESEENADAVRREENRKD